MEIILPQAKGQCHEFNFLNFVTLDKRRHLKVQFTFFYIGFHSMLQIA